MCSKLETRREVERERGAMLLFLELGAMPRRIAILGITIVITRNTYEHSDTSSNEPDLETLFCSLCEERKSTGDDGGTNWPPSELEPPPQETRLTKRAQYGFKQGVYPKSCSGSLI